MATVLPKSGLPSATPKDSYPFRAKKYGSGMHCGKGSGIGPMFGPKSEQNTKMGSGMKWPWQGQFEEGKGFFKNGKWVNTGDADVKGEREKYALRIPEKMRAANDHVGIARLKQAWSKHPAEESDYKRMLKKLMRRRN